MGSKRPRKSAEREPLLAAAPPAAVPAARAPKRHWNIVLVLAAFYVFSNYYIFPRLEAGYGTSRFAQQQVPLDVLEEIMLTTPEADNAKEFSRYLTSGPHLGGKNYSQAVWMKEQWEALGVPEVEIVQYEIYTNYPKGHRLALLNGTANEELLFEASLEEDVIEEDGTTGLEDRVPTFHGYSASGNVTAEYLFANYGTYRDFEDLLKQGVNVTGKVVLCKYGKIFRGLKVKRAQELGAVGVLMYSDPGDDGEITELNGYKPYPEGPARNPSSVQRGSVQFLSMGPGDPQTPGYPSVPGAPRQDPSPFIPSIPSLPLSYLDAIPLLKALNGHGLGPKDLGGDWPEGGLYHKGVDYNVGPAPGIVVNLFNDVEYVVTPHWDVIGKIPGYIKDEVVILGNHRDAWIAGGAGDPNSGSAALLEIARSFGKMREAGWKPTRTILLASWDGEEYGLLGSTEWVEANAPWLEASALAYLNVDVGARSPVFSVAANPLLQDVIHGALKKVIDPKSLENSTEGTPVFDVWDKKIRTLGSGSDYTAFQDFLGIPSVDMGFGGASNDSAIYHYHSNYDSFHWMEKFGDPGFKYHVAISKIWGLAALQLVESPILPFNATAYATGLISYLDKIRSKLDGVTEGEDDEDHPDHPHHPPNNPHDPDHGPPPPHDPKDPDHPPHHPHKPDHPGKPHHPHHPPPSSPHHFKHSLHCLQRHLERLLNKASELDTYAAELAAQLADPDLSWWRRAILYFKARRVNKKYQYLDRAFIYPKGLDGREVFKHVVYAPGIWTGYAGDTFPGLVESIDAKDWRNAVRWAHIIKKSVERAGKGL